ncbi:hypothetical protein ACOME3_006982 [Neoechinorhynchus agilis]
MSSTAANDYEKVKRETLLNADTILRLELDADEDGTDEKTINRCKTNTKPTISNPLVIDTLVRIEGKEPKYEGLTVPLNACELELIMDRLERNSKLDNSDMDYSNDDWTCVVCLSDETENDWNVLVRCGQCGMVAHQECYGVESIPEREWFCDTCSEPDPKPDMNCDLCTTIDDKIAIRWSYDEHWVHAICFLAAKNLSKDQCSKQLKCSVCAQCNDGICVTCTMCTHKFHPLCARSAGYEGSVISKNGEIFMEFTCHRHLRRSDVKLRELTVNRTGLKVNSIKKIYPIIEENKIDEIRKRCCEVTGNDDGFLFDRILAYWFLKRCERNGASLRMRTIGTFESVRIQQTGVINVLQLMMDEVRASKRTTLLEFSLLRQRYEVMLKVIGDCLFNLQEYHPVSVEKLRQKIDEDVYMNFEQFATDAKQFLQEQKEQLTEINCEEFVNLEIKWDKCLDKSRSQYAAILTELNTPETLETTLNNENDQDRYLVGEERSWKRRISNYSIGSRHRRSHN